MKANAKAKAKARGADDEGNLMLLAGIIVTIAFIMTALTLEQVGSLERQAAAEPSLTLAAEWRFIHDQLNSNIQVSMATTTTNATFSIDIFPAIASTFRAAEAEKGYDVTMRLAGASSLVNKTEADLVSGNLPTSPYDAWALDGSHHFTQMHDSANDGLLWSGGPNTCADPSASACIQGVLAYVHLSDGTSSLEEVTLYYVNRA